MIDAEDCYVIFDAGNGFYKIGEYIKSKKPIYIFLSHYHLDHIIGFHTLNKYNFSQEMNVYGPPGLRKCFESVINKPYTVSINDLEMKIKLFEIGKDVSIPVNIEYKELLHSSICYGYGLMLEDRVIAYCTDTGFVTI